MERVIERRAHALKLCLGDWPTKRGGRHLGGNGGRGDELIGGGGDGLDTDGPALDHADRRVGVRELGRQEHARATDGSFYCRRGQALDIRADESVWLRESRSSTLARRSAVASEGRTS